MAAYRVHLQNLNELGAGLFDPRALIRNGPGSSNYRNWVGGPANEISCGSAFVFAGYLDGGFDTAGLAPALTMAGAVRRITSDHPSVPVTGARSQVPAIRRSSSRRSASRPNASGRAGRGRTRPLAAATLWSSPRDRWPSAITSSTARPRRRSGSRSSPRSPRFGVAGCAGAGR